MKKKQGMKEGEKRVSGGRRGGVGTWCDGGGAGGGVAGGWPGGGVGGGEGGGGGKRGCGRRGSKPCCNTTRGLNSTWYLPRVSV